MVAISNCPECSITSPAASCCQIPTSPNSVEKKLNRLEDICRIALAVFAYVIAPQVALVSLAVGVVVGACYHLYTKLTQGHGPEQAKGRPACAQGYMETLSGFKYTPEANLLATATFIAVHIAHCPPFYVPFTGTFVGIWSGAGFARLFVGA